MHPHCTHTHNMKYDIQAICKETMKRNNTGSLDTEPMCSVSRYRQISLCVCLSVCRVDNGRVSGVYSVEQRAGGQVQLTGEDPGVHPGQASPDLESSLNPK